MLAAAAAALVDPATAGSDGFLVGLPFLDEGVPIARGPLTGGKHTAPPPVPLPGPALAPNQVVELVGAAGAAKTMVLYHAATRLLAPTRLVDPATEAAWSVPGAYTRSVHWIDADGKFDVRRLAEALRHFIANASRTPPPPASIVETAVQDALRRLHVYRCSDSLQLVATLHSLVLRPEVTHAPTAFVFIDGVAAFYWQDRADSTTTDGQAFYQRQMVQALRRLQRAVPTTVLATRAALLGPPGGRADLPPRDVMCQGWAQLVTHRLWLVQQGGDGAFAGAQRFVARPLPWTAASLGWTFDVDDAGIHA